ncbi:hypothetical protein, partial [Vibrio harveyi]|uniref:hypothetical protein n=1 Tax=Vibrio harveyi TaxID=669 RepID=UPI002119BA3D
GQTTKVVSHYLNERETLVCFRFKKQSQTTILPDSNIFLFYFFIKSENKKPRTLECVFVYSHT